VRLTFGDQIPDFNDKVVLITGGTGSLGTALVRRLLAGSSPRKVILFSRDEQKHFHMQQELPDRRVRFFIGDVRDQRRLLRAFEGVDVVFHAAAMKHIPLAEYNPLEAIRTNIGGAENVIDAALERNVGTVVAISTDKAASPVNLYGATKLCMEKLFVAANSYRGAHGTVFTVVRYGNVIGSRGSVVPLFVRQKEAGELTLTDPQMTRFWITMEQAVDLCFHAVAQAKGGEVFIPRIPATDLATLAGAIAPAARLKIMGLRPGEKMHEALITQDEARQVVDCGRTYMIEPSFPWWGASEHHQGVRVPASFSYTSENAPDRPSVEELRRLLDGLGFLSPAV
jgi:UDP-N-acetylglucosamine 4,6-dehydratase